jgi:cardiolipin synthase
MPKDQGTSFKWLNNGGEAFAGMLDAIEGAQESVFLETYTFKESVLGVRFRDALVRASQRGAKVTVVVDFIGSHSLRSSFWNPLLQAGGNFRWFNPWNLWGIGVRDHRKILVCDRATAFVGGFNIAPEYEGDGVEEGWRDLGLEIRGTLAAELATCVEESYARAEFKHKRLQRLRRSPFNRLVSRENWTLLLGGPGRGRRYLKRSLAKDLSEARSVQIIAAYFLPTWRIRRELLKAARRGARVQLILASKSDVVLSLLATRCLYHRLLRAGVEVYEYQPQILHAKLVVIDNVTYTGSANLDARSLNINYELLVRIEAPALTRQAEQVFALDLKRCRRVALSEVREARPVWRRWFERWAYYVLARLDPYLSRLQARDVP